MNKPISIKSALPFVIVSFILVLGPLLLAWLLTPPGYIFSGTLVNHNDFSAYLAAMRQGAEGKWLFHFNFSPEPWKPKLMLPIYLIAGKILPKTLEYSIWANILRAFGLGLTLLMFGVWVRQIFPNKPASQWAAWLMLVFGGGLGWLLWPIAMFTGLTSSASFFPDITDSGWVLVLIGENAPHYMLGLFLETLFFWSFLHVSENISWKWVLLAASSALTLGLIYVYNTTVLFATIGLYLIWRAWNEQRIPWKLWIKGALILLPLLPLLYYYGYWVNRDPAWAQYVINSNNVIPPPPWYALLMGAGLVGLLAASGLRSWLMSGKNPLLIFWVLGNLIVMYVPIVQYSGRFILGLWVPLATLAAYGLEEVILPWISQKPRYSSFSRLTPTPYDTIRRTILLLTMPSSLLVALLFIKNITLQPNFPFYMPKSEIQAMHWLSKQTDSETDLVLAYYPVGNYFPSLSNTRVFMGQFFLTVGFDSKVDLVEKFWQVDTPNSWRASLIKEWNITYIYQGGYENALHPSGDIIPPGKLVFNQDGVKIYHITR